MGGMEMGMEMGMGSGYGGGAGATASLKSSYDLPVELYGIIYIYNPVAEKKLGIELKEADPDAAPAEPAAPEPVAVEKAAPQDMAMAVN